MFLHRRELHVLNKCGRTLSTIFAFAEAVIRSVELIVHPEAKGGVGEMRVSPDNTARQPDSENAGQGSSRTENTTQPPSQAVY